MDRRRGPRRRPPRRARLTATRSPSSSPAGARASPRPRRRPAAAGRGRRLVPRHRPGRRDADPARRRFGPRRHRAARPPILRRLREAGVSSSTRSWSRTPRPITTAGRRRARRAPRRPRVDGGDGSPTRVQRGLAADARRRSRPTPASRCARRLALHVLWPPPRAARLAPGEDPNQRAIVALASVGDFDVLLPADAESDVTGRARPARCRRLKVAHHGSDDPGLPACSPGARGRRDRGRRATTPTATRRPRRSPPCAPSRRSYRPTATAPSGCTSPDVALATRIERAEPASRLGRRAHVQARLPRPRRRPRPDRASAAPGCARWPRPRAAPAGSRSSRARRAPPRARRRAPGDDARAWAAASSSSRASSAGATPTSRARRRRLAAHAAGHDLAFFAREDARDKAPRRCTMRSRPPAARSPSRAASSRGSCRAGCRRARATSASSSTGRRQGARQPGRRAPAAAAARAREARARVRARAPRSATTEIEESSRHSAERKIWTLGDALVAGDEQGRDARAPRAPRPGRADPRAALPHRQPAARRAQVAERSPPASRASEARRACG